MTLSAQLLDEITGCGRLRTENSGRESRKSFRIPLSMRAFIIPVTSAGLGRPASVRIRNISATGVGFLHQQMMEAGAELIVALPRKNSPPLCIVCSIAYCHRNEGNVFIVGARFNGPVGEARDAATAEAGSSAPAMAQ